MRALDAVMNPQGGSQQDDFTVWLTHSEGYLGAKRLECGTYVGLYRLITTISICIGITPLSPFTRRYCYDDLTLCLAAYEEIKNGTDIPEGWIASRPKHHAG